MKNKKLKIFLIILAVIIVAVGAVVIWQWNNINSVIYFMKYTEEDLQSLDVENKQNLEKAVEGLAIKPRELTQEENTALEQGVISIQDAIEISLGRVTLEEKLQSASNSEGASELPASGNNQQTGISSGNNRNNSEGNNAAANNQQGNNSSGNNQNGNISSTNNSSGNTQTGENQISNNPSGNGQAGSNTQHNNSQGNGKTENNESSNNPAGNNQSENSQPTGNSQGNNENNSNGNNLDASIWEDTSAIKKNPPIANTNGNSSENSQQPGDDTQQGTTAPGNSDRASELVAELYVLKSSFVSRLNGLADQAKAEYIAATKEQRNSSSWQTSKISKYTGIAAGLEAECDARVEAIVGELRAELKRTGGDMSIIDTVRSTYENEKQIKKAAFLNKYLK